MVRYLERANGVNEYPVMYPEAASFRNLSADSEHVARFVIESILSYQSALIIFGSRQILHCHGGLCETWGWGGELEGRKSNSPPRSFGKVSISWQRCCLTVPSRL